jgi:hypothetical protein
MINFNVIGLYHLLWMLDFYERTPLQQRAVQQPTSGLLALGDLFSEELSEPDKTNAADVLKASKDLADKLGLRSTKHRIETFELKLRFNLKGSEYINEIKVLREALKHDLSECMFYHYPKGKLDTLMKFYPNWDRVNTAFPLVKAEALAATDCYALGHNTASVFHIIRVAEHGLRAVAKERRINLPRKKPIDWATWQEVIKELGNEVKKIGENAAAGSAKDNALSFYSGALADLNAFKDEYRNQVMHVRQDYDDLQAFRALTKVQSFMDRVAEKINHEHARIKWGLKFRRS